MIDPDAALVYLDFVVERHRVWEARQRGLEAPWTNDPVLASRKFTNVYRVLDPGSQFILTDLLCDNEFEFLARCLLYRITNRPEAWRAFDGELSLTHRPVEFRQHMHDYKASGGQVFSGAYMIWGGTEKGVDKIDHVFNVLDGAISGMSDFLLSDTQRERFEALAGCRGMGAFNAMQVLTDFGYGTEFREDEFVVPGPGCRKGAAELGMTGEEAIEWGYRVINEGGAVKLPNGWTPSRMDIQNTLCEFSKYARYARKPSREQFYKPAHPGVQSPPVLPSHWNR